MDDKSLARHWPDSHCALHCISQTVCTRAMAKSTLLSHSHTNLCALNAAQTVCSAPIGPMGKHALNGARGPPVLLRHWAARSPSPKSRIYTQSLSVSPVRPDGARLSSCGFGFPGKHKLSLTSGRAAAARRHPPA